MSKQYTQKIRLLLNQSSQTVPYIFQRFYIILKKISLELQSSGNDPKIFEQFSLIYKTIKKYVKDDPLLLVNNRQKILKELKNFLNPLLIYLRQDSFSKMILEYFSDKDTNEKICNFLDQAQKIKQQILSKNLKVKAFGTHELSNAFWIKKFKNEYAVHFDSFWDAFLEFIQEISFFEYFISASSKKSIMKKVDPERKYFITSTNVAQLFYKLSEPQFLQKLADQTAKGIKPLNFSSHDFLQLKFCPNVGSQFETRLAKVAIFQISGQDSLIQNQRNKTKHPPTIIFGSSVDADVKIKNKYVSRKQFMLIEEEQQKVSVDSQQLPFSLVCLSSSNFTLISYKRKIKLTPGLIFKIADNSIQVVKISNCYTQSSLKCQEESQDSQDQDETLDYLPKKSNFSLSEQKQLEYLIISGTKKGTKGKIHQQNLGFSHLQIPVKQFELLFQQNVFYLPPETQIYVKTANQVINGELSDKIAIQEGMKIILQECFFQIIRFFLFFILHQFFQNLFLQIQIIWLKSFFLYSEFLIFFIFWIFRDYFLILIIFTLINFKSTYYNLRLPIKKILLFYEPNIKIMNVLQRIHLFSRILTQLQNFQCGRFNLKSCINQKAKE